MLAAAITLAWILALLLLALLVQHFTARQQVQRRLYSGAQGGTAPEANLERQAGPVSAWLGRAGYRRPGAAAGFVALSAGALMVGLAAGYVVWVSGLLRAAEVGIAGIPGGFGDMIRPVIYLAPWFAMVTLALLPLVAVRRSRRQRVGQVERDLPVTLELLATLAEAGLGFDAALDRILESQPAHRALAEEFRTFQVEVLAGRPRVQCLRRLARRLDVPSVSIFISALVQAEQIGSGVSEILRGQADDLRQRRRERATEFSMSLPVKLLFPLVICFLPGILVFALGPALYEFIKMADSFSLR